MNRKLQHVRFTSTPHWTAIEGRPHQFATKLEVIINGELVTVEKTVCEGDDMKSVFKHLVMAVEDAIDRKEEFEREYV